LGICKLILFLDQFHLGVVKIVYVRSLFTRRSDCKSECQWIKASVTTLVKRQLKQKSLSFQKTQQKIFSTFSSFR